MPETLWDGGPILHQAPGVFPMGTDSILLADFSTWESGIGFWILAPAPEFCRCCC